MKCDHRSKFSNLTHSSLAFSREKYLNLSAHQNFFFFHLGAELGKSLQRREAVLMMKCKQVKKNVRNIRNKNCKRS